MSSEGLEFVRENMKASLFQDREKKRDTLLNNLRRIEAQASFKHNSINIENIVKELKKHHTSVDREIIERLKLAFLENPKFGIEFLKIEGALHSLVGLIFGKDPFIQLLAVECCCNLSLGDSKTCFQVAKAATPYFISILQGLNFNLKITTLFTVGNLAGSDVKTCNLMISQGIINCITECASTSQLREAAFYALLFFTKTDLASIGYTELVKLISVCVQHFKEFPAAQWTLYHCVRVEEGFNLLLEAGVENLALQLYLNAGQEITAENVQSATCATRLLSSLATHSKAVTVIFERWNEFYPTSEKYFKSHYCHLRKENLWLFANMSSNASPEIQTQLKEKENDIIAVARSFSIF